MFVANSTPVMDCARLYQRAQALAL
ncbi:hypothetical protein KIPB_013153, partial [Kipferlia bialata]|eukprot:g13153.t1